MNNFKFTVITALTSVLSVILPFMSEAQMKVGNNPITTNPKAVLEADSSNKGLLQLLVPLTGKANASPLSSPVAGMLVYNTASAGDVIPGYYYNDGTKWGHLNDSGQGPWYGNDDVNSAKLNHEDMYVDSNKVYIGKITPYEKLEASNDCHIFRIHFVLSSWFSLKSVLGNGFLNVNYGGGKSTRAIPYNGYISHNTLSTKMGMCTSQTSQVEGIISNLNGPALVNKTAGIISSVSNAKS